MLFPTDEIMHTQTQIHMILKLFPNVSIKLERIHIFKTSVLKLTVFKSKHLARTKMEGTRVSSHVDEDVS